MSKTDKTRPWDIQATEDLREVHDHSNGECNLPTREEWIKTKQAPKHAAWMHDGSMAQ